MFDEVIEMVGDIFKGRDGVYPSECIYWIGYIYRYWHYHTNESSKEIYKQASVKVMMKNYEKFYMMTPEEVIELLKEEIPRVTISKIHTMNGIIADYERERKIVYWLIDDVAQKKHNIKWGEFENYLGQLRTQSVIKKWGEDDLNVHCLRDSINDISGFFLSGSIR